MILTWINKNNVFFVLCLYWILLSCNNKHESVENREKNIEYEYYIDKSSNLEKFVGYYPNGKIAREGYINKYDSIIGVFKSYDTTGKIQFAENYENGLREGISYYYYANGGIHKTISYSKNLESGDYIEFYEHHEKRAEYLAKYVIVGKESYLNSWVKFSVDGKILSQSPFLAFFTKDNFIYIKVMNPKFDKARAWIGDFDNYFNLKDSSKVDTVIANSKLLIKIPVDKYKNKKEIRGIVEHYKVTEQFKNGSYSTTSKDIYFNYSWK
ncbi:MAG: hypothetical protein H7Y04_04210 [Verrucomicrobia bacterium]|nr:hypothetical protein [Cytophagales bacterium]